MKKGKKEEKELRIKKTPKKQELVGNEEEIF